MPQPKAAVNVSSDRQDLLPELNAPEKLFSLINKTPQTFFINWTHANQTNDTMMLFVSPEGVRIDAYELVNDKQVRTRTLSGENSTITCSKQKEWQCFTLKQPLDATSAGLLSVNQLGEVEIELARTRSILGLRAQCFLITDDTVKEEICYGPDGIPLFLQGSINGKPIQWQAANFGLQVPATFLTSPAVPQPIRDELTNFVAK